MAEIDRDNIRGFALEFSVSGGGEGDHVYGSIVLDSLQLFLVSVFLIQKRQYLPKILQQFLLAILI